MSCCTFLQFWNRATACLWILFHFSHSARVHSTFIILLMLINSNGSCPSFSPKIYQKDLKVDWHPTAEYRRRVRKKMLHPNESGKWLHTEIHGKHCNDKGIALLVVYHFHVPILLNPKLTNNDVVDTTSGVRPGIGFIISAEVDNQPVSIQLTHWECLIRETDWTHLGSSRVMVPFGSASILLPQNFSLGYIEPWKRKSSLRPSAWKALIGGWWLTCSDTHLKPRSSLVEKKEMSKVTGTLQSTKLFIHLSYLISSYVSPSRGLKGFPVLSHCDATADTANAATHYKMVFRENRIPWL